jgi:hypothetical protein
MGIDMHLVWKFATAFCIAGISTAFTLHPPLNSQDWAAWIQAVGSILAIAVAILVVQLQAKEERRAAIIRADDEVKNALRGIYLELKVHLNGAKSASRQIKTAQSHGYARLFPQMEVNYPVFQAHAGTVCRCPSKQLLDDILVIYAEFRSFFEAVNEGSRIGHLMDLEKNDGRQDLLATIFQSLINKFSSIESRFNRIGLALTALDVIS